MGNELFEKVFEQAQDALFLFENCQCVEKNEAAKELEQEYVVSLEKIIAVAEGRGCVLHSTMEECLHCELKDEWAPSAFPLILEKRNEKQEQFNGSFTHLDERYDLLSIRFATHQDRLQQAIQNKRLIEYVNQAHEKERRVISQELHDGLAQSIYSLMLETRRLESVQEKQLLHKKLQKIDENFVSLLGEVKQMAIDLRPTALDDLGLVPAIETLTHRITETTGVIVHFIPMIQNKRFTESLETVTYRVVQESVMNSVKYAGVDELWVTIREFEHKLLLDVRDHGSGFDLCRLEQSTGLGLLHMEERAESVGGKLTIQTTLGEGTTVSLIIPIKVGDRK